MEINTAPMHHKIKKRLGSANNLLNRHRSHRPLLKVLPLLLLSSSYYLQFPSSLPPVIENLNHPAIENLNHTSQRTINNYAVSVRNNESQLENTVAESEKASDDGRSSNNDVSTVYWVHIQKTGTSLFNTLYFHFCPRIIAEHASLVNRTKPWNDNELLKTFPPPQYCNVTIANWEP